MILLKVEVDKYKPTDIIKIVKAKALNASVILPSSKIVISICRLTINFKLVDLTTSKKV